MSELIISKISEEDRNNVISKYSPLTEKGEELKERYNKLSKKTISVELVSDYKRLRLDMVKNRKDIEKTKTVLKAKSKAYGDFVQSCYNEYKVLSETMETELGNKEMHYVRLEEERINKLEQERTALLSKYIDPYLFPHSLTTMDDNEFNAFLNDSKDKFNDDLKVKQAEERKSKRLDSVKHVYSYLLEKDIDTMYQINDKDFSLLLSGAESLKAKEDAEKLELEEEVKALRESKLKAEREEAERTAKALKAEQDKSAKLLKEIADAEAAKKKEIADAEAAKEVELGKGDEEKVKDLLNDLNTIVLKYEFKSSKNKKMFNGVVSLISKIITFINK